MKYMINIKYLQKIHHVLRKKHGGQKEVTLIRLLQQIKEERGKRKALEIANSALTVDKQIMQPKADYFDELVDRNLLTNFRETAKQLGVPPKKFVTFLLEHKYIYRDKKGKLQPYQPYTESGLFNLKECVNEKKQAGVVRKH